MKSYLPESTFLSDLFGEILRTTVILKKNGLNYQFSDQTLRAKEDYDEEVNTAETYFEELITTEIWGFTNFTELTRDYTKWCDERSYSALGKKSISQAAKVAMFERRSFKKDGKLVTRYVYNDWNPEELIDLTQRWGMFQKVGSEVELDVSESSVDKTYDNLIALL